jgi:hypothetical protein
MSLNSQKIVHFYAKNAINFISIFGSKCAKFENIILIAIQLFSDAVILILVFSLYATEFYSELIAKYE